MGEATASVTIARRFNGPADSANGGYACGALGRFLPGAAEVTLRVPPPLDRTLDVVMGGADAAELRDGDVVVAEGRSCGPLDLEPPVRPSEADAAEAQTRHPYIGVEHPFSDCFVCGHGREDGMGLSFGPLAARPDVNAAVMRPNPTLPLREGALAEEILWAALDCPSYTPGLYGGVALLGRLTAQIARPVDARETLVAVGWPVSSEGRKHGTASALIDADGETVARALAVWVRMAEG